MKLMLPYWPSISNCRLKFSPSKSCIPHAALHRMSTDSVRSQSGADISLTEVLAVCEALGVMNLAQCIQRGCSVRACAKHGGTFAVLLSTALVMSATIQTAFQLFIYFSAMAPRAALASRTPGRSTRTAPVDRTCKECL